MFKTKQSRRHWIWKKNADVILEPLEVLHYKFKRIRDVDNSFFSNQNAILVKLEYVALKAAVCCE